MRSRETAKYEINTRRKKMTRQKKMSKNCGAITQSVAYAYQEHQKKRRRRRRKKRGNVRN